MPSQIQPQHAASRARAATRQGSRWLAVLVTRKAVPGELKLVASAGSQTQHFLFRPHYVAADTGIVIGECEPGAGASAGALAVIEVHRGRVGGKAAERLLVLEKMTAEMLRWPAVRWQGKLKAAEGMLREWNWHPESFALLWFALQLALHDTLAKAELKHAAETFGEKAYGIPAHVVRAGAYLAWGPQLDVMAQALPAQLAQRKTANPLRDELDAKTAARLLGLNQPALADEALERFGKLHKLPIKHDKPGGLRVMLDARFRPALQPGDAAVVAKVEELYQSGEGLPVALLRAKFPSHQHVIHWMLDAGRLVATAEGYIFTRRQLRQYLSKLPASRVQAGTIGVRDIKDILGLQRRAAEALRAYLVAEYSTASEDITSAQRSRED